MSFRMRLAALALCAAPMIPTVAQAVTLGEPVLTTEPGTLTFVNQFGPDLLPTASFTMTYTGLIATAQGAAALAGRSISFTWFFADGFNDGSILTQLIIDGIDLLAENTGTDPYRIGIFPPLETVTATPDPTVFTYDYAAPFAGFGPRTGPFDRVELLLTLGAPVPMKEGYLYCTLGLPADCSFSDIAGLTELNGQPVALDQTLTYPEGTLFRSTLGFSTVLDDQPTPIPVPAGGALLALALGGLAAVGRRARRPA
jgi:hypothetical protein